MTSCSHTEITGGKTSVIKTVVCVWNKICPVV